MATVALEGISKYFGTVPAVQDLSCTIAQGEFLALLGPSGCGKTTTLLMLAGIYRPASGTLRFDGRIVKVQCRFRGPTLKGDSVTCKGVVTDCHESDGVRMADLDVWTENQNGVRTTEGKATVALQPVRL